MVMPQTLVASYELVASSWVRVKVALWCFAALCVIACGCLIKIGEVQQACNYAVFTLFCLVGLAMIRSFEAQIKSLAPEPDLHLLQTRLIDRRDIQDVRVEAVRAASADVWNSVPVSVGVASVVKTAVNNLAWGKARTIEGFQDVMRAMDKQWKEDAMTPETILAMKAMVTAVYWNPSEAETSLMAMVTVGSVRESVKRFNDARKTLPRSG